MRLQLSSLKGALTFLASSFLMTGFSLFSCVRPSVDSVASLLWTRGALSMLTPLETGITVGALVCVCVCACLYLFLLLVEELSGEELLLALLTVSEVVVVFRKTLFPGTVRGLFTAANTGAGFGWTETRGIVITQGVKYRGLQGGSDPPPK